MSKFSELDAELDNCPSCGRLSSVWQCPTCGCCENCREIALDSQYDICSDCEKDLYEI